MPRPPSRPPRGMLAATALEALEAPRPGAAVLDRLLGVPAGSGGSAEVRVDLGKTIRAPRLRTEPGPL